ncbi:MAG: helix-turn-helix domain-containing protein [Coriobacteriales bacterium]|jgi:excisionase family DNA binding protein|nr:helix-turn-helix domain-containing protein [Coriobacteriales bacterium]
MARTRGSGGASTAWKAETPHTAAESGYTDSLSSLPQVLTLNEVAAFMRVHVNSVYPLVLQGIIPAFKVRSRWRVTRAALAQFMGE